MIIFEKDIPNTSSGKFEITKEMINLLQIGDKLYVDSHDELITFINKNYVTTSIPIFGNRAKLISIISKKLLILTHNYKLTYRSDLFIRIERGKTRTGKHKIYYIYK